ncbi:pseudouridine synthase [uncultured Ferrimonas sp.]|uniref:pseudouridine synthase n=1 Tax=uncultured Ferrimonas sp. TaxID=432640 RepID=UPI002610B660|nr:pseudouridine synthase [uncultured Ferrimonas sp.]
MILPILYQDDHLVAINKPANMLVHRGEKLSHGRQFVLQTLRDQLGQSVYPVHRLDKATSGVLLMAKSAQSASETIKTWQQVQKHYLAVVRGHAPEQASIDLPLAQPRDRSNPNWQPGPEKDALTTVRCLDQIELPIMIDKYPSSRYSLVRCQPHTGRKHQLRRHLRHLGHPILCDTRYGKNRHYHYFRDELGIDRMLLHAQQIRFFSVSAQQQITVTAPLDDTFAGLLHRFNWQQHGDKS